MADRMYNQHDLRQQEQRALTPAMLWAVGFGVVALLTAAAVYYYVPERTPDPFATLSGTLYLSTAPADNGASNVYTFDIGSEELQKETDDSLFRQTPAMSPNGERLAYVASPLEPDSGFQFPFLETLQIYTRDLNAGASTYQKLTHATGSNVKRLPEWSPSGDRIAFTARPKETRDGPFSSLDTWHTYIADTADGSVIDLGNGTYPQWSPDGKHVLVLTATELRLVNTDGSGRSRTALTFPDTDWRASTAMPLDVSAGGDRFVWSDPRREGGATVLYSILSWDPFRVLEEKVIPEFLMWPTFSPDGRYIAGIGYENGTGQQAETPRLVVYDTVADERRMLMDLSDFNSDITFLSDWVVRE